MEILQSIAVDSKLLKPVFEKEEKASEEYRRHLQEEGGEEGTRICVTFVRLYCTLQLVFDTHTIL